MMKPRADLVIALVGTGISASIGTLLGALVGYHQGATEMAPTF